MSKIITCEQVSNGHPDKICDQIADAIVTDILQHDRNARVAIECLLKKSQLFIAGEVTTDYRPNYQQIVHDVFNRIGAEKLGWNESRAIQRIHNWRSRGIPAAVKLKYPAIFLAKPARKAKQQEAA